MSVDGPPGDVNAFPLWGSAAAEFGNEAQAWRLT